MNIKSRVALVGALATALSLVSVAAPANAAGSILGIGPGTIIAKGAAVDVPVTFVCDVDTVSAFLSMGLSQKVSQGRIAEGSAGSNVTCTGESQTITLHNNASGGATSVAFKNGIALASVDLYTCPPDNNCENTNVRQEISLKNK